MTETVKYRTINPRLVPRRTRMEIPGWAGTPQPRRDGAHEQAWHCIPFSEAAKAGIELCWPHEEPLHVAKRNGALVFTSADGAAIDANSVGDRGWPEPSCAPPPVRSFGTQFYTYQSLIDLKVAPGRAVKTETHPRFYTDTTMTVPVAVPAVLRHWWPMINFLVFKSPGEGQTHIFRPGEPFIQLTIVDADPALSLVEMPEEEAAERVLQADRIHRSRDTLSLDTRWTSDTDTVFDGTYRRIVGAARGLRHPPPDEQG